ncbi:hypothetical protein Agub_g6409 [Astrephomene gubernaculifera]|uniref:Tubulin--tyrosine ligase-like protein 5 n=1 Tax=Astrephomene gubernaculifera TaxID=47775 RepID=A0AAD3DPV6_9CHLO|nr:hypothetical protein Agub_g6409 [Astrephomene gubernaculifera]
MRLILITVFLLVALVLGPLLAAAGDAIPSDSNAGTPVRLWLDSVFFSTGEIQILKDIVANSSGKLVVSGETQASFLSVKGAYVPQSWELYWTVRRACHAVLGAIAPPKRVNCIPGVEAVAYKQPLVRSMQEAYGEAAFDFIPRSYMLPTQYWIWRAWTQHSSSPADLPWVLKANEHRGRGVRVMRQRQAQRQALKGISNTSQQRQQQQPRHAAAQPNSNYVLVQSYVRQQFLYDNRPSYLRLWVVVTSLRPLRAYLFRGGVIVFGDRIGASSSSAAGSSREGRGRGRHRGAAGAGEDRAGWRSGDALEGRRLMRQQLGEEQLAATNGWEAPLQQQQRRGRHLQQSEQQHQRQQYETHQVNYWTIAGEKMSPWTVAQLRRHAETLFPNDPRVFDRTWDHVRASIGAVLAAPSGRMRAAARQLSALEGSGFEVLGIDFLLNSTLHPTLVEVNALPSLARLRTAPGDPGAAAATAKAATAAGATASAGSDPTSAAADTTNASISGGGGGGGGGGGATAGAPATGASFDLEKERFLHHALRLIGLPLGPPPPFSTGDDRNSTSTVAAAGSAAPATATTAAATPGGVLRCLAALLRPTNNETAELQTFLRRHTPADCTAAEAAVPAVRHLLCPVPASWGLAAPGWPVTQEDGGGGSGGGSNSSSSSGNRRRRSLSAQQEGVTAEASGSGSSVLLPASRPCPQRRCYSWDMMSAVADTERELEQRLDFDPIFPMAAARKLNTAALAVASAVAAAAATANTSSSSTSGGGSAGRVDQEGAGNGGTTAVAEAGQGVGTGADVLATQTRLQKLWTGLGFVRESFAAGVDMDLVRSMQYMTTTPYILASTAVPYTGIDAALDAYVASRSSILESCARWKDGADGNVGDVSSRTETRGEAGGQLGVQGGAAAVVACAVRLLEGALKQMCA